MYRSIHGHHSAPSSDSEGSGRVQQYHRDDFDRVGVNRQTFVWTVDTFTSVLGLFNDSLNRIVNEARLIADQKPIPRLVREEYNTYRDNYNRFLDGYTAFVDGLNKRFRSYELTIPLPGGNSTTTTEYAFRKVYAERPKEV